MSPEQRRGENLDGRTDLYSLGVVLREAAVGRTDFTRPDRNQRTVPARFWEIIGRLVDPDPSLRYQTASDIASDLRRLPRIGVSRRAARVWQPPLSRFARSRQLDRV